jgi:predicted glutamine amidotransferase
MVDMETTQMRIKELNKLATEMVGDGQSPNLFFVSINGNILMVTTDFPAAHALWSRLPRDVETMLEDRQNGVLASTEPVDDGSKVLRTYDDSNHMLGVR